MFFRSLRGLLFRLFRAYFLGACPRCLPLGEGLLLRLWSGKALLVILAPARNVFKLKVLAAQLAQGVVSRELHGSEAGGAVKKNLQEGLDSFFASNGPERLDDGNSNLGAGLCLELASQGGRRLWIGVLPQSFSRFLPQKPGGLVFQALDVEVRQPWMLQAAKARERASSVGGVLARRRFLAQVIDRREIALVVRVPGFFLLAEDLSQGDDRLLYTFRIAFFGLLENVVDVLRAAQNEKDQRNRPSSPKDRHKRQIVAEKPNNRSVKNASPSAAFQKF